MRKEQTENVCSFFDAKKGAHPQYRLWMRSYFTMEGISLWNQCNGKNTGKGEQDREKFSFAWFFVRKEGDNRGDNHNAAGDHGILYRCRELGEGKKKQIVIHLFESAAAENEALGTWGGKIFFLSEKEKNDAGNHNGNQR